MINLQKRKIMEVKITTIIFDQQIRPEEISAFRGALLTLLPDDPILHNHTENTVIYRYPLVQYKCIDGKAAIVGLGKGAEMLEKELSVGDELSLMLGRRIRQFIVSVKNTTYFNPGVQSAEGFRYKIEGWFPLNQENHITYQETDRLTDRISMLDSILTTNILAAHKKGMGHILENECIAYITDIDKITTAKHKGIEMLSFDVRIFSNTPLPLYCGLGKGSARGHGIVTPV